MYITHYPITSLIFPNRLLVVMYLPASVIALTRLSPETISMQAISLQSNGLGYEWLHVLPWKVLCEAGLMDLSLASVVKHL